MRTIQLLGKIPWCRLRQNIPLMNHLKKMNFTFICVVFLSNSMALSQSPSLEITGVTPTLTQGTINTEVLSEIIQTKQQEVKEQVFRNTIVKSFQSNDWTKNLNNFATYYYMYSIMDELTSGKSKTVISSDIMESSAEFAYVLGLALFIELDATINHDTTDGFTLSERVFESAMVSYADGEIETSDRVQYFNLLMDMCYDVVLNNTEYTDFSFEENLADSAFVRWYNTDNVYIQCLNAGEDSIMSTAALTGLHDQVAEKYNALMQFGNKVQNMIEALNTIKESGAPVAQTAASDLLDVVLDLSSEELKTALDNFMTNYGVLLTTEQQDAFLSLSSTLNSNYEDAKPIVDFFINLVKSDFKDFTMTPEQYESMQYLLTRFLTFAKNQFKNDVVSTIIDYILENTLASYTTTTSSSEKSLTSSISDAISSNYIYMDVESIISSIYAQFSLDGNKGFRAYVVPFITLGANYASFLNENTLTTIDDQSSSLWNLYYASEKIGLKWKIWNWEYTHSFDAGQQYEYYGKSRYWLSPPTEPTISNVYLSTYGSGLLYNLVDLTSDQNFNHAIAGAGVGVTFFNGLEMNLSYAAPFTRSRFDIENGFINLGFDIPIGEYISAIGSN